MAPRPGMPPGTSTDAPPSPPPNEPPSPRQMKCAEGPSEPPGLNEVEIILRPNRTLMGRNCTVVKSLKLKSTGTRYLRTTINASIDHLKEYLQYCLSRDLQCDIKVADMSIHVQPSPHGPMIEVKGTQTIRCVRYKYWRFSLSPITLYYYCKKGWYHTTYILQAWLCCSEKWLFRQPIIYL